MKKRIWVLALFFLHCAYSGKLLGHCQMPCGIYGDQIRYDLMLENAHTISKAIHESVSHEADTSAQDFNQKVRWIITKEKHAEDIMKIISEYFLAQRIKPDAKNYQEILIASHQVLIASMKTKQSVLKDDLQTLNDALTHFWKVYNMK